MSTLTRDFSAVLVALRARLDRELRSGTSSRQGLVRVATTIPPKVLRLSTTPTGPRRRKSRDQVFITASTIAAFADLAVWVVKTARTADKRTPPDLRSLAVPWISAVDALWQSAPAGADSRVLAQFWRDVSSALGPTGLESVKSDPRVLAFSARKRDAIRSLATTALHEGRLETLESVEVLLASEEKEWKALLDHFRAASTSAGSKVPEVSIDWLARQLQVAPRRHLTASDESQAGALDYAAGALLAAWDARSEGPRSQEAYEAIRSMSEAVFKLELVGSPGDRVAYDEGLHELPDRATTPSSAVKLLRPGVRWLDGVRSRTVVRATVEVV